VVAEKSCLIELNAPKPSRFVELREEYFSLPMRYLCASDAYFDASEQERRLIICSIMNAVVFDTDKKDMDETRLLYICAAVCHVARGFGKGRALRVWNIFSEDDEDDEWFSIYSLYQKRISDTRFVKKECKHNQSRAYAIKHPHHQIVGYLRKKLKLSFHLTVEDYEACLELHGHKCFISNAEGITLVLVKAVSNPTSWRDLCPVMRHQKFTSETRGAGLDLARIDNGRHVQRFVDFTRLHNA